MTNPCYPHFRVLVDVDFSMDNPHQLSLCAPLGGPLGSREIAVESGAHRLGPRDGNGPNGHENRPEDYPLVI